MLKLKQFIFLKIFNDHILFYPTPRNFNYFWSFGSLSGVFLVIQLVTGIFLAMHYTPHILLAFLSIEHIMRDINYGWLLRYMHANGASFFFIVVYLHISRNFYYNSYILPYQNLWRIGVIIFLLMMATAFMGYVLPWGQMSFWGATVITNLFTAIPFIGQSIALWLWGGFSIDNATLNRFFSLHYVLPFVIIAVVCLHLALLHLPGSTNPLKFIKLPDKITFYPYFYHKDLLSFLILLFVFLYFIGYNPNLLNHPDNYIEANPLVTPTHIVPEWYFLPFYAILRSIPDKLGGVFAMFFAILVLLFLPNLKLLFSKNTIYQCITTQINSIFKIFFWFFLYNFLLLGWIGAEPVEFPYIYIGLFLTLNYFFFIIIQLPFNFYFCQFLLKTK
jgi:ubiquinol-cytochrome c reductase cytochrome b subunit